jgi:hypothetical protein
VGVLSNDMTAGETDSPTQTNNSTKTRETYVKKLGAFLDTVSFLHSCTPSFYMEIPML